MNRFLSIIKTASVSLQMSLIKHFLFTVCYLCILHAFSFCLLLGLFVFLNFNLAKMPLNLFELLVCLENFAFICLYTVSILQNNVRTIGGGRISWPQTIVFMSFIIRQIRE